MYWFLASFFTFTQHALSFIHYSLYINNLFLSFFVTFLKPTKKRRRRMNPNMHNILSSYLKIKKIVGKEEGDFLEDEDGEEEEEEEEVEEKDDDVDFVEGQMKKKKLNLGGGSANNGKSGGGGGGGGVVAPSWCLVERCEADLSGCKKYHQRHRVCEIHAKAPVVMVDGLRQRFCQQCSRFHEVSEFDQAKRSCRRRLAGHNERRRKSSLESRKDGSNHRQMD